MSPQRLTAFYYYVEPPSPTVQVFATARRRAGKNQNSYFQLVDISGRVVPVPIPKIPKRFRPGVEKGGPPPLTIEPPLAHSVELSPCPYCSAPTVVEETVRNLFSSYDYSAAGYACSTCGGQIVFLSPSSRTPLVKAPSTGRTRNS